MPDHRETLSTLHTTLIDSLHGYEEALEDAGKNGLVSLFEEMIALRRAHAVELEPLLSAAGAVPDQDGSFMSTVHRAVISVQSVLTGLDERVLPGLIDGETRMLATFDEAIAAATGSAHDILVRQRSETADRIAEMERRQQKAA